ncbi:MAG: dihydrofolate reductase [bacterium]|nr:dihydrofolate reductase [bacterium]
MIILIAAKSDNNVIGKNGKIPWHIPEDLKHFKEKTEGKTVLMGRKTFESILGYVGKPLPNRKNIVITRQSNYQPPRHPYPPAGGEGSPVEIYPSIEDALRKHRLEDIYVIGGAEIYKETMSKADRLIITEIHKTIEGDTFFPKIDLNDWREISRENHSEYSFVEYERM